MDTYVAASFFKVLNDWMDAINNVLWADIVLYIVLAVGILFTIWSGFCQYQALTHGTSVIRGKYDDKNDPGAINHFQALSAALSATVGLGNIGGVALAIALGGPGAVFWMWIVGLVGMALKTTEVTLSMMYRSTADPHNPHGGPMWVASKGFAEWGGFWVTFGKWVGGIFCVTLLISAITGGNMFQSWNVADVTYSYFGIPKIGTGIILAVLVGLVIIGGIQRIGNVAGRLVPFMCLLYLLAAFYVLIFKITAIPETLKLIFASAFSPLEAQGAFIGGTAGYAFLWGMKRALFSNEAGQGSSPIAHSAAKTKEPVREAVVAGLEPFIDTLVVCTLTALVILSSGMWNRNADFQLATLPTMTRVEVKDSQGKTIPLQKGEVPKWSFGLSPLPAGISGNPGDPVFTMISADANAQTGNRYHRLHGKLVETIAFQGNTVQVDHLDTMLTEQVKQKKLTQEQAETFRRDVEQRKIGRTQFIAWSTLESQTQPSFAQVKGKRFAARDVFWVYQGATLTGKAFDSVTPGLGKWLVTLAAWLFALSTMISWSYYGEQGVVYLVGERWVLGYKLLYCALVIVAAIPQLVSTEAQLDALSSLGTGVMLFANIPIMLIFGAKAMSAYHDYIRRLKAGEFVAHEAPSLIDVAEGKNVE